MRIKPLGDKIIVKQLEEKEQKKGSIIIPDTAKEKPQEGEVVAVGPGKMTETGKRLPMDVKVGDRVLFEKRYGGDVKIDDVEYLIMREEDIIGII